MKHFDLIIIGTGGGTKLRPAANLGKKVAIIEKEDFGGTCLNRGCIPSKMFIYPADILAIVQKLNKFSIQQKDPNIEVSWNEMITRVTAAVTKDSESIPQSYEKHPNITVYRGHGRFVADKVVEINGEPITADKILIATGTRPSVPNIPGLERTPYMTSREALRRPEQPKSMIIIGGGYIAVELGYFYGMMGTKVDFLVRSRMIKGEDEAVMDAFEADFSKRFPVHFGRNPKSVRYENNEFIITTDDPELGEIEMRSEALFVATGIQPNSDDLGLENTKIDQSEKGYVRVDDHLQTTVPGVYAIGDVVGNYFFRHSVNFEGEYLLKQLYLNEPKTAIQYPPIPHAIFTNPQIAGVGEREQDLRSRGLEEGRDYVAVTQDYKNSAMGMAMMPEVGFVKLLVDKQTRQLLGAHVIGEKASDIMHMLILAMTAKVSIDILHEMVYIHPALSEVIRNACRKAVIKLG